MLQLWNQWGLKITSFASSGNDHVCKTICKVVFTDVPNWYTLGPKAPADVQVAFSSGVLRAIVSWMPAEGALTYSVTAFSGLLKLKCNTTSSSCIIPSLQCGSEYSVSVTAHNDAGSSNPTDAVSLKTSTWIINYYIAYDIWTYIHLISNTRPLKFSVLKIVFASELCAWTMPYAFVHRR